MNPRSPGPTDGTGRSGDRAAAAALDRLARRIAAGLAAAGRPWPAVGAAAVVARGLGPLDPRRWSEQVGVPAEEVTRIEEGLVPPEDVPAAVREAPGFAEALRACTGSCTG